MDDDYDEFLSWRDAKLHDESSARSVHQVITTQPPPVREAVPESGPHSSGGLHPIPVSEQGERCGSSLFDFSHLFLFFAAVHLEHVAVNVSRKAAPSLASLRRRGPVMTMATMSNMDDLVEAIVPSVEDHGNDEEKESAFLALREARINVEPVTFAWRDVRLEIDLKTGGVLGMFQRKTGKKKAILDSIDGIVEPVSLCSSTSVSSTAPASLKFFF